MKRAFTAFHYSNLFIGMLLALCFFLRSRNQFADFANDGIAREAKTIRSSSELTAGLARHIHPLITEWHVHIPRGGSFEIALQFDDLSRNRLFKREHRAAILGGKHTVRFEREQLDEHQVLHVSVDGLEAFKLPMKEDWQRSFFRRPIGGEVSQYLPNRGYNNTMVVLEEFQFFEIREIESEENPTGVLLFLTPSQRPIGNDRP